MSQATSKAAVYAAFKDGERLLSARIAERTNMSNTYINKVIRAMCTDGTLMRRRVGNQGQHGGSMEFEYFRSCDYVERETVPVAVRGRPAKVALVGAPYPSVLLNVAPADAAIGRELWSHAAIAMCARR